MSPQIPNDLHPFIFSNLPVGVIVVAGERILFANEKAAEIFGLPHSDMVGMTPADLEGFIVGSNGDSQAGKTAVFTQLSASPRPLDNLEREIRSAGTRKRTRVFIGTRPEISNAAEPPRIVVTFTDIAEHRREDAERERLLVDSRRTNALLSADMAAIQWLHDLGALFLKDGNLQEILAEVVDAAIDISGADFGNIQLVDPATSTLKILAHRGFPPWWVDYWNNVVEGKGACGTALREKERVIIEDIEQSPVFIGSPALDHQRRAGIRAVQSTPLFSRSGRLIGMFSTHYRTPHRFDERTLQLIDLLARHAADIINQAQTQAALKADQVRLGLALEAAHAGIWEWDLQTGENFWSDEVWSVYGIEPYSFEPSHQAWLQSIHTDDREQAERIVRQAAAGGTEINAEWRTLRSNGTERWIMSRGRPVLDDRGRVVRYTGVVIDISERKRIEAELFASKAKLEAALAAMTDAVFISDTQGRFIHFNEAFARFHKFRSKDECAKTLAEYPAFLDMYKADGELATLGQWALPRALLGETAANEEYMLRRKDTGESWIGSYSFAPIRDPGGAIVGAVVVGRDITDSKEAEWARLRRLKDRYRAIVMDQNDLICRFDTDGRLTFVNDAYCRTFGVDYREVLGTNFLPDIHRDDLELVRTHFHDLTPMEPQRSIEHRVFLPGGELCWQQWSGRALFDDAGRVIEYQAVGRDITERKQAEQRLETELTLRQLFMDAFPGIALLVHRQSREVVAANRTASSLGAVTGRPCYSIWLQRDTPCPWCLAPRLWETGASQNCRFSFDGKHWEAHWVPVDGDHVYLHYVLDVSVEEEARQALVQSRDELEKRVLERTLELHQSHAQLLHSEKLAAVGSLSASIAHEFNNPLQSVMTILKGIARYASLTEKEQKLMELAGQECVRMKNLVADLRDFYRPTSDKLSSLDIHGILDGLLLISKKDMVVRNIRVEKRYADNLPRIIGVSDQLKQVFLNLLNNASYACRSGGVITVGTELTAEHAVVRIEDSGTGITEEDMPHIFEPFFTTKPELKGTGLGLSVSYGIINKHSGQIEVASEPGKGSVFTVFLPLKQESHEQEIDTVG